MSLILVSASQSQFNNNRGFSLVEAMVTAGLLAILAIGMTSLISNMQKEQRRQALLQVLTSKKILFENAISNPSSWANTMTANGGTLNTNTYCLVNQAACSTITTVASGDVTTYQTLALRDGAAGGGAVFYDGTGADGAKMGFTEAGLPCNTFTTAAAGNDACPIGYRVSWAPHSATDINPKISVFAKMIYNPSNANPFKTFLNAPATSVVINSKYDVQTERTATAASKSFFVAYTKNVTAAGCSTGGFGACNTGAFTNFGTTNLVILSDPFLLINAGVTTAFSFTTPGSYKCNAKSYAFATNGAYLQLFRTNATPAPAVLAGPVASFASRANYGYSTLALDSTIQITQAGTEVHLQQKCDVVAADPVIDDCGLGFPGASAYTPPSTVEIATLNCVLIE